MGKLLNEGFRVVTKINDCLPLKWRSRPAFRIKESNSGFREADGRSDACHALEPLGFGGVVIVSVELNSQAENILNEFEQEVMKCPSISYCGFISGDIDFIIMIHVDSFNEYDKIYRKELSILPHVSRIRSSFVMREVSRRVNPPVIFEPQR